jgi:hypothetical protein
MIISSDFILDFKLGDSINHNLDVLRQPDDWDAFNEQRKERAEDVLLVTMQTMAAKYPRNQTRQYVRDFDLPFDRE